MNDTPAISVTVTHIPLTRSNRDALLNGLDELEEAYGKSDAIDAARRYLHYRWLVEGTAQGVEKEAKV